jgi:putative addiction module component (TIGR02574 family)
MNPILTDLKKLPISVRIQLVGDLWDSIAEEAPESLRLSESERAVPYRRYTDHQSDPSTGIPWQQVRAKLFQDQG